MRTVGLGNSSYVRPNFSVAGILARRMEDSYIDVQFKANCSWQILVDQWRSKIKKHKS